MMSCEKMVCLIEDRVTVWQRSHILLPQNVKIHKIVSVCVKLA